MSRARLELDIRSVVWFVDGDFLLIRVKVFLVVLVNADGSQ